MSHTLGTGNIAQRLQIVIAAAKGSEAALTIFEDLMNPYGKKQV